jgi:hydroxymethylpyrimidine kinase/phosphomethylpyrimidine kinase/thiamine-phosphate diphosphorylase
MTYKNPPIVWNIAGSDSFGAAGAQSDLKTIAMHDCHGSQVITAITSQSPTQCLNTFTLAALELEAQLIALGQGPEPSAVKIGMVGSKANLSVIRKNLATLSTPVILDPVVQSSSGTSLAGDINPDDYFELCGQNSIFLTPNIPEAALLSGLKIASTGDMVQAGKVLLEKGAAFVLIKGGHLESSRTKDAVDFYCDRTGLVFFLKSPRKQINLRGTGCTLASALAANIALGYEPRDAVILAKAYLNQCIRTSFKVEETTAIIKHEPLKLTHDIFPEVQLGEEFYNHEFGKSPEHKTGFYVIADDSVWISNLTNWNVPTLQLRIKDEKKPNLFSEIKDAINITQKSGTSLYINDHWQHAIDLNAFGVHLGQEDLARADIHAIKKTGLRLGISTHSWFEAAVAHYFKPSYIALGPVFPTTCKSMRFGPHGFAQLKKWKEAWPYPVVAIGGLKAEHASELKRAGVDGVAVISDVTNAGDPKRQVELWLNALNYREHK